MTIEIPEVSPPDPPWSINRLGARIETMLERAAILVLNAVREALSNILAFGGEVFLESLEKAAAPRLAPIIDQALSTPGMPDWFRTYLNQLKSPTLQADMLGLGGLAQAAGSGAAGAALAPVFRLINYAIDKEIHTTRPDPALAFSIGWRFPDLIDQMEDDLTDIGWPPDYFEWMREVMRPRLGPSDHIAYAIRQGQNLAMIRPLIERLGYDDEDINRMLTLSERMPDYADLVRFAVREVFDEQQAQALGLFAEFPAEFGAQMKKLGFTTEWARAYWGAHWELPSITMAFEMFHRRVINETELDSLLRALDVSPVWRNRLKAISYNTLTRVDVRRMYGMGILSADDVYQNYLDIGYNPTDAARMRDFTVAYETDTERELTKSDILSGFRDGMLTTNEAEEWLQDIGYNEKRAAYLIAREQASLARKMLDEELGAVRDLYVGHDIDATEARVQMTALGLTSSEIERKIELWDITRRKRTKRPTQAQLDDFLKRDILIEAAYTEAMANLGYQDQYIDMYLARVLDDKAEAARKAEENAREEQEKIRTRKIKSDYQVEKAQLDVDITELRTAVAETQIALRARKARFDTELGVVERKLTAVELQQAAASKIAEYQAKIDGLTEARARIDEQIEALETELVELKLEAAEDIPDHRYLFIQTRLGEIAREKEQHQDALAGLATQIAELRTLIHSRENQLRVELDIVERVASEADLRREYESDRAATQTQLDGLRINLQRLLEDKASLTVTYRKGLAEE